MSCDCLWFVRRSTMRKSQEDHHALTDPLLSVNPTAGLTMEGVPVPLKDEIRGTWHKLRLSMIFIFTLTILAVATLIYGCITVARAANNNIYMAAALNRDITSFQNGGYNNLTETNFTLVSAQQTYLLNRTADPYLSIIEQNAGGTEYNSSVFQNNSITLNPYMIDMQLNSNYTTNSSIYVNYATPDTVGSFLVSIPCYTIQEESSLQQGARECAAEGGYYNTTSMKCLTLFVLTQVCIKVTNGTDGWHLNDTFGGSGCVYPFTTPGIYEQRNYTSNMSSLFSNATINFFIRSSDDPYISLQELSCGLMSLDGVVKTQHQKGVHLVILAIIVIVITLSLGLVLFFIKRKVKREFRTASRIPNYYTRPPLYRYLALSVTCFGICMGAGFPLLAHWSELAAWDYTPFAGLMLLLSAGPTGMVSLLIFWQMLMKNPAWAPRMRGVLGGAVGALLMVLCALAVTVLMKPWNFVYSTQPGAPDQFQVFWGIIAALIFFPFAMLMLVLSPSIFIRATPESDQTKALLANVVTRRSSGNSAFALFGLFVLFVVFLATAFLPPIWNVITVGTYNIWHSPYSILPANNSNIAVIKLYLDVVVFYGFVLAVVTVGILASMSRDVRRALGYWVRVRIGSTFVDTSFGEICFLGLVGILAVWWFWWWYWGYSRIAQMPTTLERLARVFGHMTNLFSALLLFPITRNSIWVEILGIPFERAVKYHRWAGVVVFVSLTSHMLTWWVRWSLDGTLLHNIFSVQNSEHPDNWSIPMVQVTWLGAAVMVLLSQNWFRRRRFELFYYTHHFFLVFFLTGLIHAWSMWYFTGGGMILWFIDRLIRYRKSAQTFQVTDLVVHNKGDTTQIILKPNGFSFRAGQYAFINIPSITPLEWHPFTISSAPGETALTFHVKNRASPLKTVAEKTHINNDMGKTTWTARLARIYGGDGLSFNRISTFPVINVDGPYGNPPDYGTQDNIFMVAGGIGITPMISILKDLYHLHRQNDPKVRYIKHVYLLWVVRDLAILNMFREIFDQVCNDHTCKDRFHIMLRVTQRSFSTKVVNDELPINPTPVMGRPNIHQEFADVATQCGKRVLAMVCGPTPMIREVETAAYHFGFEFHMETFEL
eukprot:Phypoly_transcript_01243.p1 GENE.Phypoly_transcript_01243~~Phypoly_transcript_01243.p1  ORF type:complete len:1110 (+),score=123.04 Phypoly_transcript_01243:179-3508(+)